MRIAIGGMCSKESGIESSRMFMASSLGARLTNASRAPRAGAKDSTSATARAPCAVLSTYALARWWFLRLLGLVYLVAFWSLATQILGLGHNAFCLQVSGTRGC